jgi:integrase
MGLGKGSEISLMLSAAYVAKRENAYDAKICRPLRPTYSFPRCWWYHPGSFFATTCTPTKHRIVSARLGHASIAITLDTYNVLPMLLNFPMNCLTNSMRSN